MLKSIESISTPPAAHMVGDGFKVHNMFPHGTVPISMERISPFIMLDYMANHYFSPVETPRGVGVHPHRGFETVTVVFKGKIEHHDSQGNHGVIGEGDVQWMTAASGILHKEYHEKEFSKQGGELHAIQLWVNLPSVHKMTMPKYQAITKDMIPHIQLPNNAGSLSIIAGDYNGHQGAAETFTPVHLFDINLNTKSELVLDLPEDFNTAILVLEGELEINNHTDPILAKSFVLFKNEGTGIRLKTQEQPAKLMVLSGKAIAEPISSYGPFVMNTETEIRQAFVDFQIGKFGHLID